jgi:hypothetical protein
MEILADSTGGRGRRVTGAPAGGQPHDGPPSLRSPSPPAGTAPDGRSELQRRRDALAEEVTELHWDLGGLAYEMAIRDHFRLDVLVRRAAVLQERDAELAEVERLLRLEDSASAGSCPHCAAPHSRGALFCWQCGATLMERSPSTAAAAGASSDEDRPSAAAHEESSPAAIDALLAPRAVRSFGIAPLSEE